MRTALTASRTGAATLLLFAAATLTGCVVHHDDHHHAPPPPAPPPPVASVVIDGIRVDFYQADHWQGVYYEDVVSLYDSSPAGWEIEISSYALAYDCDDSCFDYLSARVVDPYGYVYRTEDCSFDVEVCFGHVAQGIHDITSGNFGGYAIDAYGYYIRMHGGWFDALYIGSYWD